MAKKLRFGILGTGGMGRAHGDALLKMQNTEIVAVCAAHTQSGERYNAERGLRCPVYTDAAAMINQTKMDALFVCLPPFAHTGQVEAAANKKIHLFLEKPLAQSVERGKSMMDAICANGVIAQMGYHMRFGAPVRRLKAMLQDKSAGAPLLFTGSYECNSLHSEWWRDVEKSGGQVFEQVIHLYDLAQHLLGSPQRVTGFISNQCHTNVPGYTVEDTSVSSIAFEQGRLAAITGSNCAIKTEWSGGFRLVCEKLIADFQDLNHAEFIFTEGAQKRTEQMVADTDAIFAEDEYFVSVLRGENPPVATVQEGYIGLQMVSGVVASSKKNGMPVEICTRF